MFTALGYASGSKVSGFIRRSVEILFVLRIFSLVFHLFFSYPLASKGGITVVIILPVHKLQYVINKCAACHMLSHVASGV